MCTNYNNKKDSYASRCNYLHDINDYPTECYYLSLPKPLKKRKRSGRSNTGRVTSTISNQSIGLSGETLKN